MTGYITDDMPTVRERSAPFQGKLKTLFQVGPNDLRFRKNCNNDRRKKRRTWRDVRTFGSWARSGEKIAKRTIRRHVCWRDFASYDCSNDRELGGSGRWSNDSLAYIRNVGSGRPRDRRYRKARGCAVLTDRIRRVWGPSNEGLCRGKKVG